MDPRLRPLLLGAFGLGLGLSITLAQTALALLAIRLIWRLATGQARMQWPLAWAFGAWIGVSLLAAALSPRPLESLIDVKSLLMIAGFYVVLDALPGRFSTPPRRRAGPAPAPERDPPRPWPGRRARLALFVVVLAGLAAWTATRFLMAREAGVAAESSAP